MTDTLEEALRALDRPTAGEAFRDRVRAEFLAPLAQRKESGHKRAWLIGSIAASLALVFAIWNVPQHSHPEWQLLSTGGSTVSGMLHNPGPTNMKVEIENCIRWYLLPGTTVELSSPEPNEPLRVYVKEGIALATTGPDFPSMGLRVQADFLDISVTGTTFGILAGPDSTCVCVLEGVVTVNSPGYGPIRPGMALTQFASTRTQEISLAGVHRDQLLDIAGVYSKSSRD